MICCGANEIITEISSVQSLSRVRLFVTPLTAARQASLSITNSQSLLELMSIELEQKYSSYLLSVLSLLCPQDLVGSHPKPVIL